MNRLKANPVKTISDVYLGEPCRPVTWVGVDYVPQDPLEGLPEMHGLRRRHTHRLVVDSRVRVVNDETRAPVLLRNHPQRGQPEVW